jgi:hypothetical protein
MGISVKKIDTLNEEVVEVALDKVKSGDFNVVLKKEEIVFNKDNFEIGTLIFNFQDTCNKYGITYDSLLILLYLNELSVFNYDLKIIDRDIKLREYQSLGFIVKDFTSKRGYFKITAYGKEIVAYFASTMGDISGIIKENQVLDLDATAKMKSVLADYYS